MMSQIRQHVSAAVMPIVVGALLCLPAAACQDHDPLSPLTPRHLRPKVSKTLSDGVAVTSPVDMNTSGEVLGYLWVGTGYHAGISVGGVAYDLGTTDNSENTSSYPAAINNRGQVVGSEYSGGANYYGFVWTPDQPNGTTGTITRLPESPTGPATALDINDAGQIVGIAGPAGIVLWNGSDMTSLPLPIAGGSVYWCTINQSGQIAGTAADANGATHAFLWTPTSPNGTAGSYVFLDAPESAGGYATGLNDFGQVVVSTQEGSAQLWTPASPNAQTGTWTTVTGPTGPLSAVDINSRGDVLGGGYAEDNYYCGAAYHLYLWRPSAPNGTTGITIDLTPDVGTDYYTCSAYGTFVSEEENATIQAFGYIYDIYGGYYDQNWTVANLGQPQPLTASIVAINGYWEGSDWTFDGRATPFTPSLSYQWDFGDGTTQAGRSATHVYADNGQYTVRFTVTDNAGQSNTATTSVTVNNMAPVGSFVAPAQTNEGSSYVLRVTNVSDVSADLPTVQLALDCGDGRGYQSVAITGSLTCGAPNDGLRTARAQLRDKDGGVTEYTAPITIFDVAPTVTVLSAPASIADKSTYSISFKFTDPGLLDTWSYSIDWGDGTSSAPVSVATQGGTLSASHKYQLDRRGGNKSQTFAVTIFVNDNSGAVGTATSSVMVTGPGAK